MSSSCFTPSTAHIKLKVIGSKAKVEAFHYIVGNIDPDYPFCPKAMRRRPNANLICPSCNGGIYFVPNLSPQQLKELGKQINENNKLEGNLKVKVMMYNIKCGGDKTEGELELEEPGPPVVLVPGGWGGSD